jgi:hypothetical protein
MKTPRLPLDIRALSAQPDIFRLSGAKKRDPAVDAWLSDEPPNLRATARRWFKLMRQSGDDVRELMHDDGPVACVDDAPFGYVNSFKDHVNVGFFQGAALEDAAGLLAGTGKRMRHVKLRPDRHINEDALADLIEAAYRDIKDRLRRL